MGDMMGLAENALIKEVSWSKKGGGLEAEWLEYMGKTWTKAITELTNFMEKKVKEQKEKYKCDFAVTIKGTSKVRRSGKGKAAATESSSEEEEESSSEEEESEGEDVPTTPTGNECPWIEWVHDSWVSQVKGNLDSLPWGPPKRGRPTQQNSSNDVPQHADSKKKTGGPSK
jgi:hypothetical protein